MADHPDTFEGIIQWHIDRAGGTLAQWESLHEGAEQVYAGMTATHAVGAGYFSDSVRTHINYTYDSCQGLVIGLRGVQAYLKKDYADALLLFSEARGWMERAWATLQDCEHDKWVHFYRGELQTGTRHTIRDLSVIQGLCRILLYGDPSRERWAANYLGPGRACISCGATPIPTPWGAPCWLGPATAWTRSS